MRIAVDHPLTVAFPARRQNVAIALRATPEDCDGQTVSGWRIDPDCDARLRTSRDGFGNILTMVYAAGPIGAMTFQLSGEVFTVASNGILGLARREALPPALYLRGGVDPAPGLTTDAVESAVRADDAVERLHLLNVALYRHVETERAEDLAGAFVTAARRLGVPARYVSGFLAQDGGSRPHIWAEAFVDSVGWVGFDPMRGLPAGEDHARVAASLDLGGTAFINDSCFNSV